MNIQQRIDEASLSQRPRIPVKDETFFDSRLIQSRGNHAVDHLIVNKQTLIHQALGLQTKISPVGDILPENVARRDLRDPELGQQCLCLRSLTYSGSAKKKNRPRQKILFRLNRLCL